ncbi:MAG: hypothetical protein OJF49_003232 [Ktedonobacterales bacterium]|nr:MAG: hypothetical protein OJF49_003232 [Ktedonobacterales bacterium]
MFGIFAKAGAYANLSPAARATLRYVEVQALGIALSGLQAVTPLLSNPDPAAIPWASVAHTFVTTVVLSLAAAGAKYYKAQGDPPIPLAGGRQPDAPLRNDSEGLRSAGPTPAVAPPAAPPVA